MIEDNIAERRAIQLAKNRFVVMLVGVVGIALVLVSIAMLLYGSSGAAQLDLSRPGYKDVRSKVRDEAKDATLFSSTGEIDKNTVDLFEKLYDKTANPATSENAFERGALSDEALRINVDPAPTANQ